MYCDGGVAGGGINGWYIDDILINHVSGVVNKTRAIAEGMVNDSIIYGQRTNIFTGNKIYVDPSATGSRSGTSWANAMHYLPGAMDIAGCRTADSVFVAQGTYLPNLTNNRTISFKIPNNTLVFGGFPAGGSSFAMRNPATYPTILSGDIGTVNNNSDNVYHVLKVDSAQLNLLLDGVTLTRGNANGIGDNSQGAAVFCLGNLTLKNVTVTTNTGTADGQIFRIRSASAHFGLSGCTLFGIPDGFTKVMITNSAELNLLGNNTVQRE